MPLTLLVSAAALTLSTHADTTRAATSPASPSSPISTPSRDTATASREAFTADSIVVEKSQHTLILYQAGVPMRTYRVALGQQPVGDKVRKGDMRTPEGLFYIEARNPQSRYYRSLRISYPDAAHRARARARGVSPGGDIMIHGLPANQAWVGPAHRDFDWTEGCIAVTNEEIDEIWRAVPIGTPIHIKP